MPLTVQLRLDGPSRVSIPVSAAHAAIARRVDTDHHAPVKPFTIGPPLDRTGGVSLRVGLLDDTLVGVLDASFVQDPTVRLGRHHYRYAEADVVAAAGWAQLVAPSAATRWTVQFLTPTTFRRGGRTSPWAAPESVARGLVARWRGLHPASAPELDDRQARSIWVSDVRGESVTVQGPDSTVSGFVGSVTYRGDLGTPACAAFGRLLGLAEFAGVGSFTTFGFGQVRVLTDTEA